MTGTNRPTRPDGSERRHAAAAASERLSAAGVEVVLLTLVDNAGVARARAVPLTRLEHAATAGVGLSTAWHVVTATDRVTSSPFVGNPAGDLRLVADAPAARPFPGLAGWGWCPTDQFCQDGVSHDCCPRELLRRAVGRCAALGLDARVGYELEWWCAAGSSDPEEQRRPAHDGPAVGALPLLKLAGYVHELVTLCSDPGIGLETLNAEYSDGQLECSLSPKDPLAAVDANVLARLVIHSAAQRHGMRASFTPAFAGPMGNGGHIHLSLWRDGENCFAGGDGPAGLRSEAAAFLAGILAQLVPMTAIGAPTVASYLRLQPSRWAGAFRCWGVENREAALRLVAAGQSGEAAANVEVKCFDEAANPYLLLATLLAAGAAGVEKGLELAPPYSGDPAVADAAALAAAGVERLPATLGDAVAAMERSTFLAELLGPALFDSYLAVRREEWAAYGSAEEPDIVAAYRWRF